eukprot:gene4027-305_t
MSREHHRILSEYLSESDADSIANSSEEPEGVDGEIRDNIEQTATICRELESQGRKEIIWACTGMGSQEFETAQLDIAALNAKIAREHVIHGAHKEASNYLTNVEAMTAGASKNTLANTSMEEAAAMSDSDEQLQLQQSMVEASVRAMANNRRRYSHLA